MSLDTWLSMGGYAAYVWPAYGISFLGIAGAVVWALKGWRTAKAELALLERAKEGEA